MTAHAPHLEFALALHRTLPTTGDLVWSPYSVASALGLAAAGARGPTRDELAGTVAPGGDLADLARLLADSADLEQAEAAVANTLWMREGWPFHDDYQRAVASWPGGALHVADFAHDPEAARRAINADVEKTTRQLIKELLAPGTITPATVAVLVNALYLKVSWRVPFTPTATRPAPFHAPTGVREVATMRQEERMPYATAEGWRMITLATPSEAVVDVLLPDGDLTDAELALTPERLLRLYAAARPRKVDLALPRFRVEAATALDGPLGRLGVRAAFDREQADFTGVTPMRPVWIDAVMHKAVLRVDEQGFEGAAATAVIMRTMSLDLSAAVPFHVDRPFLVVVRHARTGAIYFLARVTEP